MVHFFQNTLLKWKNVAKTNAVTPTLFQKRDGSYVTAYYRNSYCALE